MVGGGGRNGNEIGVANVSEMVVGGIVTVVERQINGR